MRSHWVALVPVMLAASVCSLAHCGDDHPPLANLSGGTPPPATTPNNTCYATFPEGGCNVPVFAVLPTNQPVLQSDLMNAGLLCASLSVGYSICTSGVGQTVTCIDAGVMEAVDTPDCGAEGGSL